MPEQVVQLLKQPAFDRVAQKHAPFIGRPGGSFRKNLRSSSLKLPPEWDNRERGGDVSFDNGTGQDRRRRVRVKWIGWIQPPKVRGGDFPTGRPAAESSGAGL